ncbi:sensor histidine kinase [Alkalihalobacterium elongatum]|uniref:sensor histidine kinase n=1 Tax=Alkalihalobacterium elongatum TaxID=2675466 RepID=UPI001C1F5E65|nr:sensor histidine kinase [Alkalihalobacterium elongatum]
MSFLSYLKERWITLLFIFLASAFAASVYHFDHRLQLSNANGNYMAAGCGILFLIYISIDYFVLRSRVKNLRQFTELNASSKEVEDFSYPTDWLLADQIQQIVIGFEKYKAEVQTQSSQELEFITKWLHDVKVPLAAVQLILEEEEHQIPAHVFERLYYELFSIEESVQRVFYEMKTNRFYDDYKIAPVNTKQLIVRALKGYSNLFSYKRIHISIEGEDHSVLTDEKWSGYILSQMISNAVKYTPHKGTISITTIKAENETTISIRNSGKGIHSRDIGQVFKKGYTASDQRTGLKATGYGLYLSKKVSDLLGHQFTAESVYNEYAMFHLTFHDTDTIHDVTKM